MGGLAALAREAGHKVTGCDAGVYPPMSDQLRALGIELIEGFGKDLLHAPVFVLADVLPESKKSIRIQGCQTSQDERSYTSGLMDVRA